MGLNRIVVAHRSVCKLPAVEPSNIDPARCWRPRAATLHCTGAEACKVGVGKPWRQHTRYPRPAGLERVLRRQPAPERAPRALQCAHCAVSAGGATRRCFCWAGLACCRSWVATLPHCLQWQRARLWAGSPPPQTHKQNAHNTHNVICCRDLHRAMSNLVQPNQLDAAAVDARQVRTAVCSSESW